MLLKELVEQIRGVSYKPTDVVSKNEGMPILRASNIQNGKLNFNDLIFLKKDVIKIGQYLKRNDILVCTSSGSKELVGKAGTFIEYPVPISFGAFCKVVRVKGRNDVNVEFIKLFFQSPSYKRQITESSLGANINNIKTENIDELFMKLPDIKTQTKAVNEMQIIISLICTKQNELDSLEEIIKSRFNEMFGNCKKIKLCDVAKIVMGQSPDSKSYNDEGIGTPFFQGKGDYGDKYTVVNHWTTEPKKIVDKGIVLMSVRAPVGPVNIANVRCCIGRGLCGIDAIKNKTNNEFLYNALKTLEEDISGLGNGSTFKAINKDDVYNLMIPDASIELQKDFSLFSELIDKSKFVVQQQIKDLEELLDKKMDEYFGG